MRLCFLDDLDSIWDAHENLKELNAVVPRYYFTRHHLFVTMIRD